MFIVRFHWKIARALICQQFIASRALLRVPRRARRSARALAARFKNSAEVRQFALTKQCRSWLN
jgi:hypothetical protein